MTLLTAILPNTAFPDHFSETYEKLKSSSARPLEVGDVGFLPIEALLPTQIAIGEREVSRKLKKYNQKTKEERRRYLLKHPVPVVVGPEGEYYIVDHHHLIRVLWELGKSRAFVRIVGKVTGNNKVEFWKLMFRKNLAYPFDEQGNGPLSAREFIKLVSRHVSGMKDDLYRSLAGAVRDKGGFLKNEGDYFIEFAWANFFRTRISIDPGKKGFKQAIQEGLEWSESPEASHLPGYIGSHCNRLLNFR